MARPIKAKQPTLKQIAKQHGISDDAVAQLKELCLQLAKEK